MSKYIASIDVGTTNIKINLFNSEYDVIDRIKYVHFNVFVTDKIFEMNLDEIWENILKGLNYLIKKNKIADLEIILTTAMHSIQLMESDYSLSGPLIAWVDKRGSKAIKVMNPERLDKQYYRTGTPIHSMNPFFKLLEMRDKLTDQNRIGSLKDVLFYRFTGEWAIDISNASSSGLYNISELKWDKKSLSRIGISERQLPIVRATSHKKNAVNFLLDADVTVYIGTSDGVSSNYVFNDLSDIAVLSLGTSHAVRVVHNKVQLNKDYQNFAYVINHDSYLIGLPSNNGANILTWTNQLFNSSFEELNRIAIDRPEAATIFLPFINGERAPLWDESATGQLSNLTRVTTRESILFSIILGMIFNIKHNVEQLAQLAQFEAIGLVGGGADLEAIPQLIADILGYTIYVPTIKNAETFGSIAVVKEIEFKSEYQVLHPNKLNNYNEMYEKYLSLVKKSKS